MPAVWKNKDGDKEEPRLVRIQAEGENNNTKKLTLTRLTLWKMRETHHTAIAKPEINSLIEHSQKKLEMPNF